MKNRRKETMGKINTMKKLQVRKIVRESIQQLMTEQNMTGAFVSLDICGGPQQGMGTTACVSIGGQPATVGQKVLTAAGNWYLLDGNTTTVPSGAPATANNIHVAEISFSNVATGTPCNPQSQFDISTAWVGGCTFSPASGPTGSSGPCDTTPSSACAQQWFQNPNANWAANWINNRSCKNYKWPSINLVSQATAIMANAPTPQTGPFNNAADIWAAGNASGLPQQQRNQFVGKMAKGQYSLCQKQACNC
jgi:hypothetical protein